MRLSIFPEAKAHPKNKEEKHAEAKKFSTPNLPQVVEILNDDQLVNYVTNYAWSPFIFDGFRREENFVSTDFLVYDVDEGLTIPECEKIIESHKLCCLCLPSPSHSDEAHRFRIILPLSRTITNLEVYSETWKRGAELFGVADEQCKDGCRGYFGCTTNDGFWIEGDFFTPIIPEPVQSGTSQFTQGYMIEVTDDIDKLVQDIYGEKRDKIPEAVDFFIKNAHTQLPGKWNSSLNSFVFSLTLSGVNDTIIHDVCEQLAPLPLDKKDQYQIKRAIRDGKAAI